MGVFDVLITQDSLFTHSVLVYLSHLEKLRSVDSEVTWSAVAHVGHGTPFVNQVCVLNLKPPASLLTPGILLAETTPPTEWASMPCSCLQPFFRHRKSQTCVLSIDLSVCLKQLIWDFLLRFDLSCVIGFSRFVRNCSFTCLGLGFHLWVSERASQGPTARLNRRGSGPSPRQGSEPER